jgi:hypothetical protein
MKNVEFTMGNQKRESAFVRRSLGGGKVLPFLPLPFLPEVAAQIFVYLLSNVSLSATYGCIWVQKVHL